MPVGNSNVSKWQQRRVWSSEEAQVRLLAKKCPMHPSASSATGAKCQGRHSPTLNRFSARPDKGQTERGIIPNPVAHWTRFGTRFSCYRGQLLQSIDLPFSSNRSRFGHRFPRQDWKFRLEPAGFAHSLQVSRLRFQRVSSMKRQLGLSGARRLLPG